MNQSFESLDEEKQKRIINAALTEFTEQDFDRASTNKIVKNAGIGKGTLFYYFTSKQDLYLYLIDYCVGIIEGQYFNHIDTSERDLFQRFKNISRHKMEFLTAYPNAMNFMATLLVQDVTTISNDLRARIEHLQQKGYEIMYRNLDYSLFRDDVDAEKAMTLIRWTFQGYEEALKYRLRHAEIDMTTLDYQPYFDEFFGYLDVMQTAFYSQEGDAKS